jgi:hypothetical protein
MAYGIVTNFDRPAVSLRINWYFALSDWLNWVVPSICDAFYFNLQSQENG